MLPDGERVDPPHRLLVRPGAVRKRPIRGKDPAHNGGPRIGEKVRRGPDVLADGAARPAQSSGRDARELPLARHRCELLDSGAQVLRRPRYEKRNHVPHTHLSKCRAAAAQRKRVTCKLSGHPTHFGLDCLCDPAREEPRSLRASERRLCHARAFLCRAREEPPLRRARVHRLPSLGDVAPTRSRDSLERNKWRRMPGGRVLRKLLKAHNFPELLEHTHIPADAVVETRPTP
mmetsp:Transcript_29676/g.96657  ORF Transcript_29676/g.96657 Transcript_29676/m.96657 type:complete len:232 (-) Transcript_29676:238-933(-)